MKIFLILTAVGFQSTDQKRDIINAKILPLSPNRIPNQIILMFDAYAFGEGQERIASRIKTIINEYVEQREIDTRKLVISVGHSTWAMLPFHAKVTRQQLQELARIPLVRWVSFDVSMLIHLLGHH